MDPVMAPPVQGDVDQGPGLIGSLIATTVLCIVVVALRFAIRGWIVKSIGWDDWTILLALVSRAFTSLPFGLFKRKTEMLQLGTVIGTGLDFVEIHQGFGRPAYYLTAGQLQEYKKYTYGEWIQTFATLMFTKVSICLFLMRIPTAKSLLRPLQVSIVILIVSNIVLTILWIVQCQPIRGAWDPTVAAKCFGRGQLERIIISQAVISAVSDFFFAAFPILILWTVQLELKSKVGLCFLMGLGVITGACCIVRTVLNFQAIPAKDVTYDGIDNWFWRLFEVQLGIIAASVPALRPGYKWFAGRVSTFRISSAGWTALTGGRYRSSKHAAADGSVVRGNCVPNLEKGVAVSKQQCGNAPTFNRAVDEVEMEMPLYCRHAIRKTTEIDVDRWAVDDNGMRQEHGVGIDKDGRPSSDVFGIGGW